MAKYKLEKICNKINELINLETVQFKSNKTMNYMLATLESHIFFNLSLILRFSIDIIVINKIYFILF